ncbi:MAG: hypothetical protein Q4E51_05415 [Lachnospiraceae bacterium]|nr:hypothetical protein [Lachnospiraceae bacterium]
MAMNRFMVSMSDEDIECFEAGREAEKMSKSAYIRLLIAEHENRVPGFIKYKEIINSFANLNNNIKEIVVQKSFDDSTKLMLLEKIDELKIEIQKLS